MEKGARVDVLVAVNGGCQWFPAVVCSLTKPTVLWGPGDELLNVRLDDGRYIHGVHPLSARRIVAEAVV